MEFHENGYIIQELDNNSKLNYCGVEGYNWDFCSNNKELSEYYNNHIDKSCIDNTHIDCCNDENFLLKCTKYCDENKINYRVIYCKTSLVNPIMESIPSLKMDFIGHDFAYAGGSFYSCVKNDLIYRSFTEFKNIKLNAYGLIENEENLARFIIIRNKLKREKNFKEFEDGYFICYKLYNVFI